MPWRRTTISLAFKTKLSCFHTGITCHNTPKTLVDSTEQLSKCFFSALFSEAFTLCDAKENAVSWKELPGVIFLPPHPHPTPPDTSFFFCRWTHTVQPPRSANTTGYIFWGRHTVQAGGFTEGSNRQRLLKSAPGTIRQSWQVVIHRALTAHTLPLSLHICLCLGAFISLWHSGP